MLMYVLFLLLNVFLECGLSKPKHVGRCEEEKKNHIHSILLVIQVQLFIIIYNINTEYVEYKYLEIPQRKC